MPPFIQPEARVHWQSPQNSCFRRWHFLIALVRRCSGQKNHAWVKLSMGKRSSDTRSLSQDRSTHRQAWPAVPSNAQLAHGPSSSAGIRGGQCLRETEGIRLLSTRWQVNYILPPAQSRATPSWQVCRRQMYTHLRVLFQPCWAASHWQ